MRVALIEVGNQEFECSAGYHMKAEDFARTAKLLRAAQADVVIFKLRAERGDMHQAAHIARVLEREFEHTFRTVVWIDLAVMEAAAAIWSIDELYITPTGYIGGATVFYSRDPDWEYFLRFLDECESISTLGGRNPIVLRAMFIGVPTRELSVALPQLNSARFDDGEQVFNLGFTASDAVESGVVRGMARNRDELLNQMRLSKVEWIEGEAVDYLPRTVTSQSKDIERMRMLGQRFAFRLAWLEQQHPDATQQREKIRDQVLQSRRDLDELDQLIQRLPMGAELLGFAEPRPFEELRVSKTSCPAVQRWRSRLNDLSSHLAE